jgi:Tfp pilus assembly protein FimT
MRASTREGLIRSIEYHEAMACELGGEKHMEQFRQRREEQRKANEVQQEPDQARSEAVEGQEQNAADQESQNSQRRRTLDDEQQNTAPQEDQRSPEQILADTHADAACQIRELLAAQPPEPAIEQTRRRLDASGTVPRTGQPRPRFAS